jgi:type VI secretion system protein ImpD
MSTDPNLASSSSPEVSFETTPVAESLLDFVLRQPTEGRDESSDQQPAASSLDSFLAAASVEQSLDHWLGALWKQDPRYRAADSVANRLSADIAAIDGLLNEQVNAILHHPRFQKLESSWRGLAFLVRRADMEGDPLIQIRVLPATWTELEKDFERAVEFDQSQVFRKVYEEEFGRPGGEPFGLMIGDYDISHRVSKESRTDDISVLRSLAGVAASAFCPFLCAAKPELLDLESISELQITRDHAARMSQKDYIKWNSMREDEDSRFLGVLLPKILMRGPYTDDGSRIDRFQFSEDVRQPDGSGFLWGNPSYAYAAVAMRSFANSGWLADVRGLRQDEDGGGLVSDLPSLSFPTDAPSVIPLPVTEVAITDALERQLSDLGMLPLCDCKDTPLGVFASGQSLQKPRKYDTDAATANAKISAMLPYMLTVSRFAHYVKVIGRTKTGSFATADELESILHNWIMDYVTPDREASTSAKSRRPLRAAEISVRPDPSRPGSFHCTMRLAPHYELDEMVGSVRLTTSISGS